MNVYARPHPGPLPWGEGGHYHGAGNFSVSIAVTDSVSFTNKTHDNPAYYLLKTRRMILPLLGERAGVRADVIPGVRAAPEESCFTPCHH